MSRFALIVRAENVSTPQIEELVMTKLQSSHEAKMLSKQYDQWLKLARDYQPQLTASAESMETYSKQISELVERYRSSALRRDTRMTDYARRVPMALAKSEFRDVNDGDLEKSLDLFKNALDSWN